MSIQQLVFSLVIAVPATYLFVKGMEWYLRWSGNAALKRLSKGKTVTLEDPKYGTIETSAQGITFHGANTGTSQIPWSAITRLNAFKRDLLTVDLICLAVVYNDKGTEMFQELHEEMIGFKRFIDDLPHRFPISDPDWWIKVAHPAFVTNMTTLWRKESPTIPPTVPSPAPNAGDIQ